MPTFLYSHGSSFCLAQLPLSVSNGQHPTLWRTSLEPPPFYESQDVELPALYWQACWDIDVVRGAAVFGNAFGEVVACDFSASSQDISSCFVDAQVPAYDHEEVLPSVREVSLKSFVRSDLCSSHRNPFPQPPPCHSPSWAVACPRMSSLTR